MINIIRNLLMILALLIFTVACDDFFSLNLDLGDGYELSRVDIDDYKIIKDKKVVVKPTIVSFDFNETYIVGLILKTIDLECENGPNQMVTKDQLYFIVNKETDEINRFESKVAFTAAWKKVDPHKNFQLDFDKLEETWAYLNSFYSRPAPNYWKTCKSL